MFFSTYKGILSCICSLVDFLGVSQHHKGIALRTATSVECIEKNPSNFKYMNQGLKLNYLNSHLFLLANKNNKTRALQLDKDKVPGFFSSKVIYH